jgi:hypothetical protein
VVAPRVVRELSAWDEGVERVESLSRSDVRVRRGWTEIQCLAQGKARVASRPSIRRPSPILRTETLQGTKKTQSLRPPRAGQQMTWRRFASSSARRRPWMRERERSRAAPAPVRTRSPLCPPPLTDCLTRTQSGGLFCSLRRPPATGVDPSDASYCPFRRQLTPIHQHRPPWGAEDAIRAGPTSQAERRSAGLGGAGREEPSRTGRRTPLELSQRRRWPCSAQEEFLPLVPLAREKERGNRDLFALRSGRRKLGRATGDGERKGATGRFF